MFVLDTTLRDGSYEVEFQFFPEDTAFIGGLLDRAGIKYIELCHGMGVGVDRWRPEWRPNAPKVKSPASDEEHIDAARSVIHRAKWGVLFCVPLLDADELERLAQHRPHFVRLAFWPHRILEDLHYVERAKALGFTVSVNLMQTPAATPLEVARASEQAAKLGADWFYIVDSAGSMSPEQVQQYVRAVRSASGLTVGLHAHNNTGMAVANSLAALTAGAELVDGTIQGIGRATGNAPTEQLLLALRSLGHERDVDMETIAVLADACRELFLSKGNDPTHFMTGAAGLHSRVVPKIHSLAAARSKPLRTAVLEIGRAMKDRGLTTSDLTDDLIAEIIDEVPGTGDIHVDDRILDQMVRGIVRESTPEIAVAFESLAARALRRGKKSVAYLFDDRAFPFEAPLAWEDADFVGVAIPVARDSFRIPSENQPSWLIIDRDLIGEAPIFHPHIVGDSVPSLTAQAVTDLITAWRSRIPSAKVLINVNGSIGALVEARLRERDVPFERAFRDEPPSVVVRASGDAHSPAGRGDFVILLERSLEWVDAARSRGAYVVRPLICNALSARATELIRIERRMAASLMPIEREDGSKWADIFLPPGTMEVVVDDVRFPNKLLETPGRPREEVAREVARARLQALLSGKGML